MVTLKHKTRIHPDISHLSTEVAGILYSRLLQGWDLGSQKRSRLICEAIWKPLDNMESCLQLLLCLVFSCASAQSVCLFSVELCLLHLEKIKWRSP